MPFDVVTLRVYAGVVVKESVSVLGKAQTLPAVDLMRSQSYVMMLLTFLYLMLHYVYHSMCSSIYL